jgi:ribosomal-protein-alanine N-acetyltransferase
MDADEGKPAVQFRPMTLRDIPRAHEIDMLSFALPWTERSLRFELTDNKHAVPWVAEAEVDGRPEVVAMLVIWVIIDEAHVATIATHPAFRGTGIGTRLLARGLIAAYERGARAAYLEVRRGNEAAQRIYRNFGFQVVGERLKYYKDNNEDALLMTLETLQLDRLQMLFEKEAHRGI